MTAEDRARVRAAVDAARRQKLAEARVKLGMSVPLAVTPDGIRHGALTAYCNGCRCDDCRTAARNAKRRQRRRARLVAS